jgi:hypothetical protein
MTSQTEHQALSQGKPKAEPNAKSSKAKSQEKKN